ncbi:MAG: ADP-ribosylation factor-like protein [Promethearchaeota archaeon]
MDISKCSFLGAPAVGKTTILKLISGKDITGQYIPTQGFDRGSIKIGKQSVCAWDFGGQKAFLPFYKQYFMGSDLIVVVTDSTPVNVLQTKQLIKWAREINEDDDCNIIAIANKQDLQGHMSAERVSNVLGVPAYPLIATEKENKGEMYSILKRHINKQLDGE